MYFIFVLSFAAAAIENDMKKGHKWKQTTISAVG